MSTADVRRGVDDQDEHDRKPDSSAFADLVSPFVFSDADRRTRRKCPAQRSARCCVKRLRLTFSTRRPTNLPRVENRCSTDF